MPAPRIGRQVRALRKRLGWNQAELGRRIGGSRQLISRIENDNLDGVPVRALVGCAAELGALLRLDLYWQGERLPRLLDERHAALQNAFVLMLERWRWVVKVETSFNHYGDRGRIDVLAWHPTSGVVVVTEIKPDVGDAQDTIGRLDVKVRIAPMLATELGWRPTRVVGALVLENGTSPRRHIEEHDGLFRRFALRGRAAKSWLRRPVGGAPTGILLFLEPGARH